jgi:hypothetical protein
MGVRMAWDGRLGVRRALARGVAVLLLALGGLMALGLTPALATVPGPPVPTGAYGGQLEAPEPGTTFNDEQMLEVGMLALGSINGLAFAGVVIVSRFRGASAEETRHALMNRTAPGVPSGLRPRGSRRTGAGAPVPAGSRRSPAPRGGSGVDEPMADLSSRSLPPVPHQGGPAVPAPRPPAVPALRPAAPRG